MGKTKKPFIDKKNSSTYHLLYRSQRDVGGDGSATVLWPSSENNKDTDAKVLQGQSSLQSDALIQWKEKMQEVGLVDDYDYEKHLKPITGTGDFFGRDGRRDDPFNDVRAVKMDDVREVERQLDAIALTPDCMDDDIAQALFGEFDETDFEEILDDFCITAAQEPDDEEIVEFDFDAHIQQLMEKAKLKGEGRGIDAQAHDWGRKDQDFFSKVKPLHEAREDEDDDSGNYESYDENEDDEAPGVVPALSPDEERALCEKFEQTLAEYDSDEVGGLDDECEYIGGERPLEGDARVEEMLDEYLVDKEADFYIDGTRHLPQFQRKGGAGFHTLQRGTDEPEPIEKVLAEAQDFLQTPEMMLPPEEILIDGKSYFSQSSRNPWDCESVLSTYSNLDNNPATIGRGRRKGKKTKKVTVEPLVEEEEEKQPVQIRLSNKTGLPLGVLPGREKGDDFDFETIQSVNKGEKRIPGETAEEKRLRKQQVKQERLISRIQKKMMKEAFQQEFLKAEVVTDDLAGKSVFRF